MLHNLKLFEHWPDATSGKFHIWFHVPKVFHAQNYLKYCVKYLGFPYKVYMKHRWILFWLGSHPQDISLYICKYPQIWKKKKNPKSETFLVPSILDKEYSTFNCWEASVSAILCCTEAPWPQFYALYDLFFLLPIITSLLFSLSFKTLQRVRTCSFLNVQKRGGNIMITFQ